VNGLRRYVQRRLCFGLSASFAGFAAFGAFGVAGTASAAEGGEVSPAALVAARELFHEATEDVDAGRFGVALEKFKRVASVKETPAVRFNIGRCEESLGRTGTALADFELAEREARLDAKGEDIEKLAHDRAGALRPKVPRLTVLPPSPAIDGVAVMLDGAKLTSASFGVALPVDPGKHVVDATAPGRQAYHVDIELKAGDTKQVPLALDGAPDGDPAGPSSPGRAQRTWGWIGIGTGAALALASVGFVFYNRSAVSDIQSICPDPKHCKDSRASEINAATDRANLGKTLSIAFGAGAAVAAGLGVYLLVSAPSSPQQPAAWLTPSAPGAPAGVSLHATF
jgi:hypothetical protein